MFFSTRVEGARNNGAWDDIMPWSTNSRNVEKISFLAMPSMKVDWVQGMKGKNISLLLFQNNVRLKQWSFAVSNGRNPDNIFQVGSCDYEMIAAIRLRHFSRYFSAPMSTPLSNHSTVSSNSLITRSSGWLTSLLALISQMISHRRHRTRILLALRRQKKILIKFNCFNVWGRHPWISLQDIKTVIV